MLQQYMQNTDSMPHIITKWIREIHTKLKSRNRAKQEKREPKWNNNRIAIAKLNISFPSFPPYNTTTVVSVTFAYVIISSVSCVE